YRTAKDNPLLTYPAQTPDGLSISLIAPRVHKNLAIVADSLAIFDWKCFQQSPTGVGPSGFVTRPSGGAGMSRFRIRCSAVSAVAGRRRRAAAVSVAAYMALVLLLAACTPGWDPGGSELVELQVDGHLVADGPDVQSVTLRAGGRPSAGFTFGSLQVYGDESPVEPLAVTESRPGASGREAVVALDVRSLAEAGVRVV